MISLGEVYMDEWESVWIYTHTAYTVQSWEGCSIDVYRKRNLTVSAHILFWALTRFYFNHTDTKNKNKRKIEVFMGKYIFLDWSLFYFDYVLHLLLRAITSQQVDLNMQFMCFPNVLIDSHLTMLVFQSFREMKNLRERRWEMKRRGNYSLIRERKFKIHIES